MKEREYIPYHEMDEDEKRQHIKWLSDMSLWEAINLDPYSLPASGVYVQDDPE